MAQQEKSGIVLIKEFFGTGDGARPVGMDEMKALSSEERAELADAIAAQKGLTKKTEGGRTVYV